MSWLSKRRRRAFGHLRVVVDELDRRGVGEALEREGLGLELHAHLAGDQIGKRNLRVFLSGRQARVPEQLLNTAEVGPGSEQVRGVGVPETMRMH